MHISPVSQPLLIRRNPAQQTPLLLPVSHQEKHNRLFTLERMIVHPHKPMPDEQWLNDYLDLGLDEALRAGNNGLMPLQESWLMRLYSTLRCAAVSSQASPVWRALCFDYLYQPFFVLQNIYHQTPGARAKLCRLSREFSALEQLFHS